MKIFLTALFMSAIVFLLVSTGCKKSSEDKLGGVAACDTTAVSYSLDVVPILKANCYECHGSSSNAGSGGIVYDSYDKITKWAANGYLKGNISHAPGYVPMPYGRPMLPDCEVNTVVAWVNQGYKNN